MFYKYNAELLCLFSHVSSCFHDGPSDNLHTLHSSKMIQFLPLASLPWQPDSFLEPTFLLAYHPQSRGRRPAVLSSHNLTTPSQPEQVSTHDNEEIALIVSQDNGQQKDWGEAPHIDSFYGREEELSQVEQWIIENHSRVVAG